MKVHITVKPAEKPELCTIMIGDIDFSPEWRFQTSRSRGAGGQNVNKVETRVELIFNVPASQLLTEEQKGLIQQKLAARIDNEGNLHVTSEEYRSQLKNKERAAEKFYTLLENALRVAKPRKKTRPTRAMIEKRLAGKKIQSQKKQDRRGTLSAD